MQTPDVARGLIYVVAPTRRTRLSHPGRPFPMDLPARRESEKSLGSIRFNQRLQV